MDDSKVRIHAFGEEINLIVKQVDIPVSSTEENTAQY